MFKIDNIGPYDVTNLQNCLSCNNGGTGDNSGSYSGTGFFGRDFPSPCTINQAISLLRQPETYFPTQFGLGLQHDNNTSDDSAIILGSHVTSPVNNAQHTISIGKDSGLTDQQEYSIALGYEAAKNNQSDSAIAIGYQAGFTGQNNNSISIGSTSGYYNQGTSAIAIGRLAGNTSQKSNAVALGAYAGNNTQGINSIGIGNSAAQTNQGNNSVAIGYGAALNYQGANCVAIGNGAAMTSQGNYSIAIGYFASTLSQPANCICINATESGLDSPEVSSCVIAPIRNINGSSTTHLFYNSVTGELTWGTEAPSSRRYKENISPISDTVINNVLNLNPVEFDFIETKKHSYGLIAEDTNDILPDIVLRHPETSEIEGVDYKQLIAPLLHIAQQQQKQQKVYEEKLQALESKLNLL